MTSFFKILKNFLILFYFLQKSSGIQEVEQ